MGSSYKGPMPRVRATTGEIDEPGHEWDGKHTWRIDVYSVDDKVQPKVFREIHSHLIDPPRVFDTAREAREDSRPEVLNIVKIIQEAAGVKADGSYFDLKTGLFTVPEEPHEK